MSYIPRPFIDELLSRADIVGIIESFVSLKKQGNNYIGLCPFHNEKTPSFVVSPNKQIYHCFGCGVGGNAISFVIAHERLTFVEAVELLAHRLGLTIPSETNSIKSPGQKKSQDLYSILQKASEYYEKQLYQSRQAIEYLKNRGLNEEIVKHFHIGYAPEGWENLFPDQRADTNFRKQLVTAGLCIEKEKGGVYDRFRHRVMFPIHNQHGKIVGFGGRVIQKEDTPKYLNSPETPIFHKGNLLYGLYQAFQSHSERLLVVEGYMDVIALTQHGIDYAVATLGTATTEHHIKLLFRRTSEVIFCFDGDAAGQSAAWHALETILPVWQDGWNPKFMFLPLTEDPDSMIRQEGKEAFEQRMQRAQGLSSFLFKHLLSRFDITQTEERAAFADQALKMIRQVAAPLTQALLLQELSKLTRIPVEQLKKMTASQKIFSISQKSTPQKIKLSPMRLAIALLVQYPELISHLDEKIFDFKIPGIELFKEIILILKNKTLTTGVLLEHFRGTTHEHLLDRLAHYEFIIPEEKLRLEFKGALDQLAHYHRDLLIEHLLSKSAAGDLTETERQELLVLLREKS
ncbi:MAG: DNA primase [Gammaproteobacteria bacterium]|nr:DNA primase [Gammaproteobacteria bacterium]